MIELRQTIILLSSITLLCLASLFFIGSIVTYAHGYKNAVVITIVNKDVLSAIICTSMTSLITAMIGIFAVYNKDRHLLGCHTLLLWPCLALLITVGYISYKDTLWDLKTILGQKWRYDFTPQEQFQLQSSLNCCGFENSSDHAMYLSTSHCTQESLLQGCHEKLFKFESDILTKIYSIAFILLPIQMIMIIIALFYTRLSQCKNTPNTTITTAVEDQCKPKPANLSHHHCSACENWTF